MITNDNKLIVFENFIVDHSLLKYRKRTSENQKSFSVKNASEIDGTEDMDEDTYNSIRLSSNGVIWNGNQISVALQSGPSEITPIKNTLFDRIAFWRKTKPKPENNFSMSVEDFFTAVKLSSEKLQFMKERAHGYELVILNAKKSGQKAFVEQLEAGLNVHKMEGLCLTIGLTKFISEENVVRFYKKTTRGVRLDWISNFTRVIPPDLVEKKLEADNIGIFDNYVVMHYDPNGKSYAETEAEKARKKDPILFGLMKGSRKLYYIGDWIDELCDLTLEQLATELGSGSVSQII